MAEGALQDISPLSVGQILKATRIARGLTLEVASKSLCLSKRHLINFEEDQDTLFCDVYTLGFLKLYAEYLDLDKDEISQKFKDQHNHSTPRRFTIPAPLPGRGIPSFRILAFSLFILLAVILGWGYYEAEPPSPQKTPSVSPLPKDVIKIDTPFPIQVTNTPPQQTPFPSSPLIEIEEPFEEPEVLSKAVLLKITEKTWIEVTDKEGHIIVRRLFKPGESYEFSDPQHLFLKTGNMGGIHLSSGEQVFHHSGKSGDVKRDIPLDPEKWLEQTPNTD